MDKQAGLVTQGRERRQLHYSELPENAENAVPPKAWENQKKAYDDAWKNNKNQNLDNDF